MASQDNSQGNMGSTSPDSKEAEDDSCIVGADGKKRYVFLYEMAKETQDRIQLRNELLNVLLAGRDTTASLLSNTFFVLARRPDIWAKLKAEVDTLGGVAPTYETLRGMKYIKYLLNECESDFVIFNNPFVLFFYLSSSRPSRFRIRCSLGLGLALVPAHHMLDKSHISLPQQGWHPMRFYSCISRLTPGSTDGGAIFLAFLRPLSPPALNTKATHSPRKSRMLTLEFSLQLFVSTPSSH